MRNRISLRNTRELALRSVRRGGGGGTPGEEKDGMSLRKKAILIVLATSICLIAALSALFDVVIKRSYGGLEAAQVRQNALRAKSALENLIGQVDSLTLDWASWDDAYAFVRDLNEDFVQSNLGSVTWSDQHLCLIAFLNDRGDPVWDGWMGSGEEAPQPVPASVAALFGEHSKLRNLSDPSEPTMGLVVLPEGVMLISSRPLLKSDGQGPARGSLVMGRLLDEETVQELRREARLDFAFLPSDSMDVHPDVMKAILGEESKGVAVKSVDDALIRGYALLRDIYGNPALILRLSMDRDIARQGGETTRLLAAALVICGLCFGVVVVALLDSRIVSRISQLSGQVREIDLSGGISGEVSVPGNDEIGRLGADIDAMVRKLREARERQTALLFEVESAREALEDANAGLERKVEERAGELKKLNERLFDLNELKTSFLSSASHELRTPLTSVLGFAKIMEKRFRSDFMPLTADDPKLSRKAQGFCENFQIIQQEGHRLTRLVNDLLDLNKIESRRMPWRDEEIDLGALLRECLDAARDQAKDASGVSIRSEVPEGLPRIVADPERIRQVVQNLLSNALKFTPRGEVFLSAQADGYAVEIRVLDQGVGIPREEQDRVFDKFYQTQRYATDTDKPFGSGLGLAICRQIVDHYGGDIRVVSEVGKGSEFVVRLPRRSAA